MAELKNKKPQYAVKDNGLLKISVKDVDTIGRTICAVLNTYNYLDSDMDVLMPGCAAKSIKERGVDSKCADKILHALFHDLTRLPGKIKVLDERTIDGLSVLYMESKLTDTTDGNDTLKNYLAGIYNQHSIGYQYMKADFVFREGHGNSRRWDNLVENLINPQAAAELEAIYRVDEIKLYEGSTVAFGANALTPCLGMKSLNKDVVMVDCMGRIDLLERTLKSGTQSDEMMYRFELQVLQLKQVISDIFQQFKISAPKTKVEKVSCQNSECVMYGIEVNLTEEDNCDKCGEALKSEKEIIPTDFYSKLATELTA